MDTKEQAAISNGFPQTAETNAFYESMGIGELQYIQDAFENTIEELHRFQRFASEKDRSDAARFLAFGESRVALIVDILARRTQA